MGELNPANPIHFRAGQSVLRDIQDLIDKRGGDEGQNGKDEADFEGLGAQTDVA